PHRPVQADRGAGEGGPRRAAAPHPDPLREGPDCGQVERGRQREILRGHQGIRHDPERGLVPDGSLARRRRDARGPANGLPGAVEREDERKRGDADPEGGPASLSRTEYQDVASKGTDSLVRLQDPRLHVSFRLRERKRGDADPEGGPASLSRTEYQDVASKGTPP